MQVINAIQIRFVTITKPKDINGRMALPFGKRVANC